MFSEERLSVILIRMLAGLIVACVPVTTAAQDTSRSTFSSLLEKVQMLRGANGERIKPARCDDNYIAPEPTVPTPDIAGVEFSVNFSSVVITWEILSGLEDNAKDFTEIWRVGPFRLLADGSYPAMSICTDLAGDPLVNFVEPVNNVVDLLGAPLPTPAVRLIDESKGYIAGDSDIDQGAGYVYWLRFMGTDGIPTAWHSANGTLVRGLFSS